MTQDAADRLAARAALGAAAVLTVPDAVRLLPFRDAVARAWLRDSGLIHDRPPLGRYVIWGEVVAALSAEEDRPAKPARGTLPRAGVYRPKR